MMRLRLGLVFMMCLLWPFRGQAQDSLKDFKLFFTEGMSKTEGVFPVYTSGEHVFLEIPKAYIGREIEIGAQIDRGFDLLSRPAIGLGVVRILSPDEHTICFQQSFYEERMLCKQHVNQPAFELSNVQSPGVPYPVVAYSPQQGAVIEVTNQLLNGTDWFRYDYSFIRSLVPNLSQVMRIHPFREGVSFTVRRYHGYEGEQNNFSSSLMLLPEGSIPLDVTCVIRLLPTKKDPIRLADSRIHYQSVRFKDYAQNPYTMVEDSLILHWDLSRPIVFYVDTLFPKPYFSAVKRGVLAWNDAFRRAGIRNALHVNVLPKGQIAAEQRALIAYDLRLPGVKETLTYHPRTGEILSCRLNIGHGFLKDRMDDYLLRCGATDRRIVEDRFSREVENELLQSEVMRAVGRLLGLSDCLTGSSAYALARLQDPAWVNQHGFTASVMDVLPYNFVSEGKGMLLKIGEDDYRSIYFGYVPTVKMDCYKQREYLRKWLAKQPERVRSMQGSPLSSARKGDLSAEPAAACTVGIEHLSSVLHRLDQVVYPKGRPKDSGYALTALYRKAIRLYAAYLTEIANVVGSGLSLQMQRQAMTDLGTYLFHPELKVDCDYVKTNLLETKNKVLYPLVGELFDRLLSTETISALRCQALVLDGYGVTDFFRDLYRQLFNDFNPATLMDDEQLDLQLLCLQAWLNTLKKNVDNSESRMCLERELCVLYRHLSHTATVHRQQNVRDLYRLMMDKIRKVIPGVVN